MGQHLYGNMSADKFSITAHTVEQVDTCIFDFETE
jgi:hypothetical protein